MKRLVCLICCVVVFSSLPGFNAFQGRAWAASGNTLGEAWDLFNKGYFEKAEGIFTELAGSQDAETAQEALLGLGYARLKQERFSDARDAFSVLAADGYRLKETLSALLEALVRLEESEAATAVAWNVITVDQENRFAHTILAWHELNTGDYPAAEKRFSFLVNQDPTDMDSVLGLGYSLYHQDRLDAAARLVESEQVRETPEIRELQGYIHRRTADRAGGAGDFQPPEKDVPGLKTAGRHRHRSGDPGTSRLDETVLSAKMVYPYAPGRQWALNVSATGLSSGSSGATHAGSFYRHLNGQFPSASPDSNLETGQLSLEWHVQGPIGVKAFLGTSSLKGPVSVTPILCLSGRYDGWRAEIHRLSVDESILSFAGLKDPYGPEAWGRVVKNGVRAGKSLSLGDGWWMSLDAGVDAFRGKNVWDNTAWQLNAATGKTFPIAAGHELTTGLYALAGGFDHNTNFFTFGHGGYYSPDFMAGAGPFVRFRTAPCNDFLVDVQVSVGWMREELSPSPVYPIHQERFTEFTPDALVELRRIYPGETENRLAYSARAEIWKPISRRLAVGALASIRQSSDFVEWELGIGVDWLFGGRKCFRQSDILESRALPCRW